MASSNTQVSQEIAASSSNLKNNDDITRKNSRSDSNNKPSLKERVGSVFLKITQGVGTVIDISVKKLTRVLYLYTSIEGLANLKLPGVMANVATRNTPWEWYPKQCLQREQDIYEGYHVFIETPTLSEAPIAVHAESHGTIRHYQLRDKLLNLYKDLEIPPTILAEAHSFDDVFPCEEHLTCTYPAHDGYEEGYFPVLFHYPAEDRKDKEEGVCRDLDKHNPPTPVFYPFSLPKEFNCRGWDKKISNLNGDTVYNNVFTDDFIHILAPKLANLGEKFDVILTGQMLFIKKIPSPLFVNKIQEYSQSVVKTLKDHVRELPDFVDETLELEKSMSTLDALKKLKGLELKKHVKKHIQLLQDIHDKIITHMNNVVEHLGKLSADDDELVERNKLQIEAAESIRQSGAKAIVLTGKEHVISKEEQELLDKTGELSSSSTTSKTSKTARAKNHHKQPQSELRAYYKQRSAALLIPKKQPRQKSNNHFKKSYR